MPRSCGAGESCTEIGISIEGMMAEFGSQLGSWGHNDPRRNGVEFVGREASIEVDEFRILWIEFCHPFLQFGNLCKFSEICFIFVEVRV